jgi:hypothetical protein
LTAREGGIARARLNRYTTLIDFRARAGRKQGQDENRTDDQNAHVRLPPNAYHAAFDFPLIVNRFIAKDHRDDQGFPVAFASFAKHQYE